MKKTVAMFSVIGLVMGLAAFDASAMTPDEARKARYEEVKKLKDAQRQQREAAKKEAGPSPKANGFWQREGERSGLSNPGGRVSSFVQNLNPAPFFAEQRRRYDERKGNAVTGVTVKKK